MMGVTLVNDASFADLLAQDSPLMQAWGHEPVCVNLATGAPVGGIDEVLRTPLLGPPFVSMFFGQRPIALDRYTSTFRGAASLSPALLLDISKLRTELSEGSSMKFNRMELWDRSISAVASLVSDSLGWPVEVWGFFSGEGKSMLPWHRDPSDNVILQISGRKRWLLGGAMPQERSRGAPERVSGPVDDVVLAPGDCLYLPYGWAHRAESVTPFSYHVSLAIQTPSVREVREVLWRQAVSELQLNADLPFRTLEARALLELFPKAVEQAIVDMVHRQDIASLIKSAREAAT